MSASTPARAATLQAGINWVVNSYFGVGARMAAPSIAYWPSGSTDYYTNPATGYYANGGVGSPNIHPYAWVPGGGQSAAAGYTQLNAEINSLVAALPDAYKTKIIVGEIGFGEYSSSVGCASPSDQRMNSNDWSWFNTMATQVVTGSDPVSTSGVQLMTVWRLDRLASPYTGCEATFGVMTADLRTYLPAGVNMFRELGGTGNSPP